MAGPIVFDIETGKLPEPLLTEAIGWVFKPPKPGRTKDPAKLAAQAEEKRQEIRDKAALDARLGRVLAIGYLSPRAGADANTPVCKLDTIGVGMNGRTEEALLADFWKLVAQGRTMIGWNCKKFDLPFLVRRSIILGIDIPDGVVEGRYFSRTFTDAMELWGVGDGEFASLDSVGRACGFGGKPDGMDGAQFEDYFLNGDEETKRQALEYLKVDLHLTWSIAERIGVR